MNMKLQKRKMTGTYRKLKLATKKSSAELPKSPSNDEQENQSKHRK